VTITHQISSQEELDALLRDRDEVDISTPEPMRLTIRRAATVRLHSPGLIEALVAGSRAEAWADGSVAVALAGGSVAEAWADGSRAEAWADGSRAEEMVAGSVAVAWAGDSVAVQYEAQS